MNVEPEGRFSFSTLSRAQSITTPGGLFSRRKRVAAMTTLPTNLEGVGVRRDLTRRLVVIKCVPED
jgi:hypothetical protein